MDQNIHFEPEPEPDESDPARLTQSVACWLIGIWAMLYFSLTLMLPPLLDDADSVHAEVAREMLLRNDWVTLSANGIRYLEKAPILYWSMAASMKAFGVGAGPARIPLALTMLALTFLMEHMARKFSAPLGNRAARQAGLYAGLLTLTCCGLFLYTRITIPDAMVCLWLTLALACYRATESLPNLKTNRAYFLCWGFAAACALNVLTKGLIGLVFPLVIVAAHLLCTRGPRGAWQRLRGLHLVTSLAVFLLIAAPWHLAAGAANPTVGNPGSPHRVAALAAHDGLPAQPAHWVVPEPTDGNVHGWTWFYFMNEHVLRYLNLRVPRDYDTIPLYLFYGLLAVWLMPWSAFLGKALGGIPWRAVWPLHRLLHTSDPLLAESLDSLASARLLCALWAAAVMLFFSFSTRQEYYCLPALPALILLLAVWLAEENREAVTLAIPAPRILAGQRISVFLLVVGSIGALIALFFVIHTQQPGPTTDLATLLAQNPKDYALSLGHFLDLNAQAMGMFRNPLIMTVCALFGGTAANWYLRRSFRPHDANLALVAATIVFLFAAHLGLQIFSPVISSEKLTPRILADIQPADIVILHGEYEAGSTLGFYLKRDDLHIYEGRSSNLWYGSFFPDAPHIFETRESLNAEWTGNRRVYLWTPVDNVPILPGPVYPIARGGGKEILSNKPSTF